MTAMVGALSSERWLDEVLVTGTLANLIAGDQSHTVSLPAGSNDLAVMEILVFIDGMTTPVTDALMNASAVLCDVIDVAAAVRDIIGVQPLKRWGALAFGAYFSPDPLVLWRQGEVVRFFFPAVESAGNTGDLTVRLKCVRVRPVEQAGVPLQLVR